MGVLTSPVAFLLARSCLHGEKYASGCRISGTVRIRMPVASNTALLTAPVGREFGSPARLGAIRGRFSRTPSLFQPTLATWALSKVTSFFGVLTKDWTRFAWIVLEAHRDSRSVGADQTLQANRTTGGTKLAARQAKAWHSGCSRNSGRNSAKYRSTVFTMNPSASGSYCWRRWR